MNCPTGDVLCVSSCSRQYQNNIESCPCQSGCPNGCPCPEYECPATTTTTITSTTTTTVAKPRTEILILSTHNATSVPIITNAFGREDRNFYFMLEDDIEINHSCPITWRNEFYLFGGWDLTKQILKVDQCTVKKIGSLPFNHMFASCANVNDKAINLCFNAYNAEGDYKKCRFSSSPTGAFNEIPDSNDQHRGIQIAASDSKIKNVFAKITISSWRHACSRIWWQAPPNTNKRCK